MKINFKVGGLLVLSGLFFSGGVLAQGVDEIISNERARVIARGISASIVGAIAAEQSDEGKKILGEVLRPIKGL